MFKEEERVLSDLERKEKEDFWNKIKKLILRLEREQYLKKEQIESLNISKFIMFIRKHIFYIDIQKQSNYLIY